MQTSNGSIRSPFWCALCVPNIEQIAARGSARNCVLCIAAFWAMPRDTRAQLYIAEANFSALATGSVGEYNATTGAVINANFFTGFSRPQELAVATGNTQA
jgi:hypothetical protein